MKLTPLDLMQQSFKKRWSGYATKEVDGFLELVRSEWETLLREKQQLEETVRQQEERLREFRERERTLQETLITAQRLSEDMKQTAKKEAEIIISQAEHEADKIIHQAHGRLTQIIDEINDLKRQRAEFEGRLISLLESHRRLLELQTDSRDTGHVEDVAILPTQA